MAPLQKWLLAATAHGCEVPPLTMIPVLLVQDDFNAHIHGSNELAGEDLDWLSSPQPAKITGCNKSSKLVPRRPDVAWDVLVKLNLGRHSLDVKGQGPKLEAFRSVYIHLPNQPLEEKHEERCYSHP